MLVVKVEVWPGGNEDRAFEISRIGIANEQLRKERSSYSVTALLTRDKKEEVVRTEVRDHERSAGWIPLVRRVFTNLILRDSVCEQGAYDDQVAQLLRRGDHAGKRRRPQRNALDSSGS